MTTTADYVGKIDPVTREVFLIEDASRIVQCKKCKKYQFRASWYFEGCCTVCGHLDYQEVTISLKATLTYLVAHDPAIHAEHSRLFKMLHRYSSNERELINQLVRAAQQGVVQQMVQQMRNGVAQNQIVDEGQLALKYHKIAENNSKQIVMYWYEALDQNREKILETQIHKRKSIKTHFQNVKEIMALNAYLAWRDTRDFADTTLDATGAATQQLFKHFRDWLRLGIYRVVNRFRSIFYQLGDNIGDFAVWILILLVTLSTPLLLMVELQLLNVFTAVIIIAASLLLAATGMSIRHSRREYAPPGALTGLFVGYLYGAIPGIFAALIGHGLLAGIGLGIAAGGISYVIDEQRLSRIVGAIQLYFFLGIICGEIGQPAFGLIIGLLFICSVWVMIVDSEQPETYG